MQWSCLPASTRREFSLNGTVPVVAMFIDHDSGAASKVQKPWTDAEVDGMMHRAAEGKELVPGYCGATAYLSAALHAHPPRGRQALVVGSLRPWVESVLLLSGASAPVTTVDFNPAPSQTHRIRTLGALEFRALSPPPRFDLVVSYSSIEHDGLGRYGDALNPRGDLDEMRRLAALLNPSGLLLLGVPVGRDALVFNAHRIYGPRRLALLTRGWDLLGVYGSGRTLEELARLPTGDGGRGDCDPNPATRNWEQPILVLRPKP